MKTIASYHKKKKNELYFSWRDDIEKYKKQSIVE
jgi:hypothetical protein